MLERAIRMVRSHLFGGRRERCVNARLFGWPPSSKTSAAVAEKSSAGRDEACTLCARCGVSPLIRGRGRVLARKSDSAGASSPLRRPSSKLFARAKNGLAATFKSRSGNGSEKFGETIVLLRLRVEFCVSPPIRGRADVVARQSAEKDASSPFRRPTLQLLARAIKPMAATFT